MNVRDLFQIWALVGGDGHLIVALDEDYGAENFVAYPSLEDAQTAACYQHEVHGEACQPICVFQRPRPRSGKGS